MPMGWQQDVLAGIDAPITFNNVLVLNLWARSEGMPAWENNWLATTYDGFGGYNVNGVGVKAYPSEQAGVLATVATLQESPYRGIVFGFEHDQGPEALWTWINQSPWCSGCQGGKYPVALYDYIVSATGQPPTVRSEPAPTGSPAPTAEQAWENFRTFVHQGAGDIITGIGWITDAIQSMH